MATVNSHEIRWLLQQTRDIGKTTYAVGVSCPAYTGNVGVKVTGDFDTPQGALESFASKFGAYPDFGEGVTSNKA